MKIRHLEKRANGTYRFKPSKAMYIAGFRSATLGADHEKAAAYVRAQNEEWDRMREAGAIQEPDLFVGTVEWLTHEFTRDPAWYRSLGKRTQEEVDYAFKIVNAHEIDDEPLFKAMRVSSLQRRHIKRLYNDLCKEGSAHRANKVMKWFRRALEYAYDELEIIEFNPADRLRKASSGPGRSQVWSPRQFRAVIDLCLLGYQHRDRRDKLHKVRARPSVALAAQIAYDTSLPCQDVLALARTQYDGRWLSVTQIKPRGNRDLEIPLSDETCAMVDAAPVESPMLIISEETGRPYDVNTFGRVFRKFRRAAGVHGLTFHDLRRTALTEMGNRGATNAEVVAFSGHDINSPVLKTYVKPGREAARRGREKRGR